MEPPTQTERKGGGLAQTTTTTMWVPTCPERHPIATVHAVRSDAPAIVPLCEPQVADPCTALTEPNAPTIEA